MSCRCDAFDTVPWSRFTDHTSLFLDRCPSDVMEHFIRASAIDLARQTLMIQRDLWIDVQEGVQDYNLDVPDNYNLHMVREVRRQHNHLLPVARALCHNLGPRNYYFEQPCQIMIGSVPTSDCAEGLYVRAVVIPSQDSCEIDAWMFDRYGEDIAYGALSRAYLMTDAAWYNTRDGGIMMRRWNTSINRIKVEKAKNGVAGPMAIKIPRYV